MPSDSRTDSIQSPVDLPVGAFAPWLSHYPMCVPKHLDLPQAPVYHFLEQSAARFPDRIAYRYAGEEATYHEFLEDAHRAAAAFVRMGVQPGDRIGLLLPNTPEYLIALYGAWMAGAAVVSLSPLLVAEEIDGLLEATGCKVVVALDLLAGMIYASTHRPQHLLHVSIGPHLPILKRLGYNLVRIKRLGWHPLRHDLDSRNFRHELLAQDRDFTPVPVSLDTPAYILPTGGTTGHPKAVMLSHRNLVANAWQLYHWAACRVGEETFLAVLPFFHSYGLSTCATTGVALAATLVLHHRFDVRVALHLLESEKVTIFHAVPAMLKAVNTYLEQQVSRAGVGTVDLSNLKFSISGGAALDPGIAADFAKFTSATVVEGYGLSEASPVTHVGPLDGTARPGTIGLPLPNTEALVVDAKTGEHILPPGEVGELIIRGPQVMLGYWNAPEETARAVRGGWLYTGDLATYDADGFFRIVDRKKDLIITSGFNVYPADVEAVLRKFPGVTDAAVIGVPDEQRGELVKAVLVMERGTRFDARAFDRFTHEHLAKHKRPRAVEVFPNDLPRNFLGKVQRRKLRERPAGELADMVAEPSQTEVTGTPEPLNRLVAQPAAVEVRAATGGQA